MRLLLIVLTIIIASISFSGGACADNFDSTQSPPQSNESDPPCVDKLEGKAVITSLSQYTGQIGTKLVVAGCNFSGFEGDKNLIIENSDGVIGILYGEEGSTSKLIKVTLNSPLCTTDTSYSGLPCPSYLTLKPGSYKIWTKPYGADTKSNIVGFTLK